MAVTMTAQTTARTEAEVLADGMFMLVRHGFFPNRHRVQEACRVVGLSLADLSEASVRLENPGRYQPPAGSLPCRLIRNVDAPEPVPPSPPEPPPVLGVPPEEAPPAGEPVVATPPPPPPERPAPPAAPVSHAHGSAFRHQVSSPPATPAAAVSPAPRPVWPPIDLEAPAERVCERCSKPKPTSRFKVRGGYVARKCDVCEWIVGRRRRYEEAVGAELLARRAVVLSAGSPLLEGECIFECGRPLAAGERLLAVDVLLGHERCLPHD